MDGWVTARTEQARFPYDIPSTTGYHVWGDCGGNLTVLPGNESAHKGDWKIVDQQTKWLEQYAATTANSNSDGVDSSSNINNNKANGDGAGMQAPQSNKPFFMSVFARVIRAVPAALVGCWRSRHGWW